MAAVRIFQWNACGLTPRREFKHFVAENDFHICCIQETFLKPDKNYSIPGYDVLRQDRITLSRGGLVTLVKSDIKYRRIDISITTDIECLAIELKSKSGTLTIINVYIVPGTDVQISELEKLFKYPNSIITGDLNAKSTLWGSPVNNKLGDALETLIDKYDFTVLNTGQPTYQCPKGGVTHLDISLSSINIATKCTWHVLNNSMGSDHIPTVTTLNNTDPDISQLLPKWKLDKANWDIFENECRQEFAQVNITIINDTNVLNKAINNAIIRAASASVPRRGNKYAGKRHKSLPYWNDKIKDSIKARNIARNKMNRSKELNDCIQYRRLKGQTQRIICEEARSYWQDYCSTLNDSTKLSSVWAMARKMNGTQSNTRPKSVQHNNRILYNNAKLLKP